MKIQSIIPQQQIKFSGTAKKSDNQPKKAGYSENLLLSSLIALASFSPVSLAATDLPFDEARINTELIDDTDYDDMESTSVSFKENGNKIVDAGDFKYSSPDAKRDARPFLKGLDRYQGKKWTQATEDLAENLTNVYNRSHTYAFDLNTDEMVKDKAFIAYDKAGRVLSTTVTTPYGVATVVNYKYNKEGNIDAAEYVGEKIIEYRKNGTRFSSETVNPFYAKEIIRYNKDGHMVYKTIEDTNRKSEFTFDANGDIIKHFSKDSESGWQKIYNDGEVLLATYYDGKGRVNRYVDDYFEKKAQDVVVSSGYLSTRTVRMGQDYNVLYKEAPLDGKIDKPIRQGTTGTCYAAGIINSLVRINAGRRLLDNALPSDFDTSKCIVDFKGLDKKYSIPADIVSHNMSRLGRKDADYAGMIYAYEKFRESDAFINREMNLPECFYKEHRGSEDRRVDSGTPMEFYYALTGKLMSESGKKITDADIMKARRCLETGRGVVNAGTILKEDKNDEIPMADREFGVFPKHNVAIVAIGDRTVTMYDSVTERETAYPIEKFKKYFSKLYWTTVD